MELGTLESVSKLNKDVRKASADLGLQEIRFLVDLYYTIQDNRIATNNQVIALEKSGEPNVVIDHYKTQFMALENQIKYTLDKWTDSDPLAKWAKSQFGIGPVISAGLRAHIDISRCKGVGNIWSFAGLVDGVKWEKGQKRPWNAKLKTLCWKAGQSFIKTSNSEKSFYGKIYRERKEREIAKNEAGDFAEQARRKLEKFKIGKDTDAYKSYSIGKLPPAQINARASRYAVKLFLSHYFEVGYKMEFGVEPPMPYPIAHMNHIHKIEPNN